MTSLLPRGSLSRDATLVVFGDAINFASGILTAMLLARLIPPDVMGTYRQLMYLGPMAITIAELGLSNTVYRYWNAFDIEQRITYEKMIVIISFALGAFASIILALSAGILSDLYHNPLLKPTLLITSLFPLASIPLMLLRPVMICRGRPLAATLLESFFSLLSISALVIPLWSGIAFLASLKIWICVVLSRLIAIPFVFGRDLFSKSKIWDKFIISQVWEFEFPIQVGRIPGYITGYLDKVVMSLFLSTKEFSIYSMGAREIPFIGNIGASISNVLVPNLVMDVQSGRYEQVYRRWRLACNRTATITYLITAFCVWYSIPVMQFLFSVQYTESSIPFRIFSAITFLRVIEYASLAKAFGRGDIIMKASFITAGSLIFYSIPLTFFFKIPGMSFAVFLSTLSAVIFYLYNYRKLLNTKISSFFPWQQLLLIASYAFFGVMTSSWLVEPLLNLSNDISFIALGWKLIVLFLISGIIFLILLLFQSYFVNPNRIKINKFRRLK